MTRPTSLTPEAMAAAFRNPKALAALDDTIATLQSRQQHATAVTTGDPALAEPGPTPLPLPGDQTR